jgi:hypothetical protein
MKSYNTLYYLLFVLLIMGAFASMAQNSYGLRILGGVAIVFGLIFLYRFIKSIIKKGRKALVKQIELLSLTILAFLFALRIFHYYFPFIEMVFTTAGLILAFIYGRKMILHYQELGLKNSRLAIIIFIYYLSLFLFIITLVATPILPKYSSFIGAMAFILSIVFFIATFLSPKFLIDGADISVIHQVIGFRDNSIILLSLFFLMSLYIGFTRVGLLPAMYSDDFPQAYFNLVNKAESGEEKPVDGRYRHEEFKKRYDEFLHMSVKKNP